MKRILALLTLAAALTGGLIAQEDPSYWQVPFVVGDQDARWIRITETQGGSYSIDSKTIDRSTSPDWATIWEKIVDPSGKRIWVHAEFDHQGRRYRVFSITSSTTNGSTTNPATAQWRNIKPGSVEEIILESLFPSHG